MRSPFPQPGLLLLACAVAAFAPAAAQQRVVSFSADIAPILRKHCLPCHAEDQYNPSELSLDSYRLVMKGGKSGAAVLPGRPKESLLVQKLGVRPPVGDRMPLDMRKRKAEPKKLPDADVRVISEWVAQGAPDN